MEIDPYKATMKIMQLNEYELNRMVAKAMRLPDAAYSTDWSFGGPLIESERVSVYPQFNGHWCALFNDETRIPVQPGKTALQAAMRCIVCRVYGENIPEL